MKGFTSKVQIDINAPIEKVWDALTNPEIIKKYFFGTETISTWKEGDSIEFRGTWEGTEYLDKGTIIKIDPPKLLEYTYLSSFSDLPDVPESYANIKYELSSSNGKTLLTITQDNQATKEASEHSESNWKTVMEGMKALLE